MRLLDTDILIDVQRRYQPAVEWLATLNELPGVPGFVVMELYQDAPDTRRIREVDELIAPLAVVWPNERDCQRALSDFRALHLSHGVGLLDALIGATAIGLNATLVTFNLRHFRPLMGLITEQPYSK
jgi:predicted nucleic acid-binding protein